MNEYITVCVNISEFKYTSDQNMTPTFDKTTLNEELRDEYF